MVHSGLYTSISKLTCRVLTGDFPKLSVLISASIRLSFLSESESPEVSHASHKSFQRLESLVSGEDISVSISSDEALENMSESSVDGESSSVVLGVGHIGAAKAWSGIAAKPRSCRTLTRSPGSIPRSATSCNFPCMMKEIGSHVQVGEGARTMSYHSLRAVQPTQRRAASFVSGTQVSHMPERYWHLVTLNPWRQPEKLHV